MPVQDVSVVEERAGTALGNPPDILRFDRVSLCFDDKKVLDDISFTTETGETVIIVGAAASGKTVLLKTAIGLICPDIGRVHLLGQDISNLKEVELFPLRRRVGMLFQESALFDSLTVEENVSYPLLYQGNRKLRPSEVLDQVKEALSFVDLVDTMDRYPSELSGGMRRRVGIARAAVTKPPLMLYDSPTAGLDPITAFRIMALAIRQRDIRNTTLLVVTYRPQDGHLLANYAYDNRAGKIVRSKERNQRTKFVVLREGRLVFEGSEQELCSSSDPYISKFAWRPSH